MTLSILLLRSTLVRVVAVTLLALAASGESQAQVWQVTFSNKNAVRKPAPDNVTFSPSGTYTVPAGTTVTVVVEIGMTQPAPLPNRGIVFVPTAGTTPVNGVVAANGTWTAADYTNLTPSTSYAFRVTMTSTPAAPFGTNESFVQLSTPP